MDSEEIKDTIVIGAGPAGIAAAVQLQRHGLDFTIFEKGPIGGLLNNANLVENYPGFPDGIPGRQLVALLKRSSARLADRLVRKPVISLDFSDQLFKLHTDQDCFRSRAAIIASGTKPRLWTDTQIPDSVSNRVFYEVFPIIDASDKTIAIVGAGDAAFDYALNLTRDESGNRAIILNRGTETRCLPLLMERSEASGHIDYRTNTRIIGISDESDRGIVLQWEEESGQSRLEVDYLLFAIGREPLLDFVSENLTKKQAELEQNGLLFLAGDVKNDIFRQTAISVGQGVMAAMKVNQILNDRSR